MSDRHFARSLASLEGIFAFVAEFTAANGLDGSRAFDLELVLEELFTNQLKYNPEGAPELEVRLERRGASLVAVLRDFDVEPFDVSRAPVVDLGRPLNEREPGGLGLHLVRRVADSIRYDYRDRCSTISVTMSVEP
jgi:serine/threonine-protein kinase RsbW